MPQEAWSNKRERQYEHVKDSAKERGASTKRAKEIAARTVTFQSAYRSATVKTPANLQLVRNRRPGMSPRPDGV